jgi:hypothetical protein
MANLQDLINLSKADGGKFYVLDNDGEIRLVILPVEEYRQLLGVKLAKKTRELTADVEKVNREILQAQLSEDVPVVPIQPIQAPEQIIPKSRHQPHTFVDLREEVIDPSFDFEGPKLDIDEI